MKWNQEIFYNNILRLITERCAGNATIFNEKIHSRDAATRWKTKKPTLKAINTIMDVFEVSYDWLTANKGEMINSDTKAVEVTLRDVMKLQQSIIELGAEIGKIKDRMLDAAQTGDIKMLGIVGGKG